MSTSLRVHRRATTVAALLLLAIFTVWVVLRPTGVAFAHCDTLDGPVVTEAKAALEKGDVTPVLKWVKKEAEAEIQAAFRKALAVRAKGPDARDLADTFFFETLVRVHRAGEGAPYTGLKPAGEVEPGIAAADQAIAKGDVTELAAELGKAVERSVTERFAHLRETQRHKDESVEAGRAYVEAYVVFIHYVEKLHATLHATGAHAEEGGHE